MGPWLSRQHGDFPLRPGDAGRHPNCREEIPPFVYWATIVASTTAGTTMADFATRSLGVGYPGGSLILFASLMAVLGLWYWSLGSISVETVSTPKVEAFYWAAITFSQTLGTALGDWLADTGLGYPGGALVFGAALAVVTAAYYWTPALPPSRTPKKPMRTKRTMTMSDDTDRKERDAALDKEFAQSTEGRGPAGADHAARPDRNSGVWRPECCGAPRRAHRPEQDPRARRRRWTGMVLSLSGARQKKGTTDYIEGPSIKMANDLARLYGNCDVDCRAISTSARTSCFGPLYRSRDGLFS